MARPFQTFEEWYQSDQKRMKNPKTWSYPQRPVWGQTCTHRNEPGLLCRECSKSGSKADTYETMKLEFL